LVLFVTLVATLVGHPQVHLGELHIQFLHDQIVENVLSATESLVDRIEISLQKSGRNLKRYRPVELDKALVFFIEFKMISSPLDYLNYFSERLNVKPKILSTHDMIYAFSIADANMSFSNHNSLTDDPNANPDMITRNFIFPFSFNWDNLLFSFVTCSGEKNAGFYF